MTLRRAALYLFAPALVFAAAAELRAQAPGAMMGGPPMSAPGGAPPCYNEFGPLRSEAETRANAIKTAVEKKSPRPEVCQLFNKFAAAEAKVVKYVESNQTWCGIPPDVVKQMKANHDRTQQTRKQVCSGGQMGGEPQPAAPSLSEALGTSRSILPTTAGSGRGTFDTLTGTPLAR